MSGLFSGRHLEGDLLSCACNQNAVASGVGLLKETAELGDGVVLAALGRQKSCPLPTLPVFSSSLSLSLSLSPFSLLLSLNSLCFT